MGFKVFASLDQTQILEISRMSFFPLPVWPDLAIYWTLGNFFKPLAQNNLPKSPTFLGNLCKGVKIYHFSGEIVFGQLF